jgi:NAD(P)-dependent dehydrogenase (short-subunit alcohol dehydrogenase family)
VRVGPIDELTSADVEASWRTGVLGCARTMQIAHPHLRGGGRIVNVVSPVMLKSNPAGFGLYAACKEAIRTLTRTAAVEWGRDGIRVNAIAPQAGSPAWADWSADHPAAAEQIRREILLGRIGDATLDVGPVAVFLASAASRYVTGSLLGADGGRGYLR